MLPYLINSLLLRIVFDVKTKLTRSFFPIKDAETIFVQNTNWNPLCRKHTMQSAAITVFF